MGIWQQKDILISHQLKKKKIQIWCAQKDVLKELSKGKCSEHGESTRWPQLEADISKCLEGRYQNDIAVATQMIHISLKSAHSHNVEYFKGGTTWCYHFMKHNGLCMCTKTKLD
jgi:hypothetical protein